MKKIRKICDKIISKTNIPKMYWDDYYDKAVDILLKSMDTYDESKNCKFSTYFYGNLVRRKETWKRDCIRFKRCNLVIDSKGKIMRDKDGNPIVIPDISIHMKVDPDEDYTLEEGISSGFNLEGEIINRLHPTTDKIEMYPDDFITVRLGEEEYVIDSIGHTKTHGNIDDTSHLCLNVRDGGSGFVRR